MSRRSGQNPKVRFGKRADGTKYFYFQIWVDVPGQEERQRKTEVLGLCSQMTKSEAERKKLEFISNLKLNSGEYKIPSSRSFANAVKHYREVFAPRMLRESTFSIADGHIRKHLEADWNDVPVERITIDAAKEWSWKKRREGLSWVTIKNILRTMQRVLSAFSKDKKPPFSQEGLAIPECDKLQMKIDSREAISFSWQQSNHIGEQVKKLEGLEHAVKERDAMAFILAAASGLRCGELFALRIKDIDFQADTIRVDESVNPCTGSIGQCKNAAAYRTLLLADAEGKQAMKMLKDFLGSRVENPKELVTPLRESNVLRMTLHPALRALGLPQAGMHAFRHGCNRRWELSGMNPAVLRQQMGHSSHEMTVRYTGVIPLEQVRAAFSLQHGRKIVVLENMENEVLA